MNFVIIGHWNTNKHIVILTHGPQYVFLNIIPNTCFKLITVFTTCGIPI